MKNFHAGGKAMAFILHSSFFILHFEFLIFNLISMLRLNVFIRVAAENRAAALQAAKELVAASLSDKGCIAYDVFESATRPDVLMICETWADQPSLDAHQKSAHFTTLVPRIESLGEMKLEQFEF